jgi:hypothetical protein
MKQRQFTATPIGFDIHQGLTMTRLFSPLQFGPYTLNHRVVHAPTTR